MCVWANIHKRSDSVPGVWVFLPSSNPPLLGIAGKVLFNFLYPRRGFCYYNNAFSARHLDLLLLECVCVCVSSFCWLPPPPPLMLLLLLLKREDIVWVGGWWFREVIVWCGCCGGQKVVIMVNTLLLLYIFFSHIVRTGYFNIFVCLFAFILFFFTSLVSSHTRSLVFAHSVCIWNYLWKVFFCLLSLLRFISSYFRLKCFPFLFIFSWMWGFFCCIIRLCLFCYLVRTAAVV